MDDGFSTVDGFVEVNNCVGKMIKYVANEPSVGLYYVQQHTHNALPNLLHLKDRVVGSSYETTLHTQDLEDSILVVDSMKSCGLSITDDMLKDINNSLMLMSASHPQRGGLTSFHSGSVVAHQDTESSGSYFSSVLKTAKQKAGSIKWSQLDPKQPIANKSDQLPSSSEVVCDIDSTLPNREAEELPLSSKILAEQLEGPVPVDGSLPSHDLASLSENYEEFKANKEAELEEWLGEMTILANKEGGNGKE
ncbi:hypothetical protein IFM89_021556 [Coptis chinensis]|uniref:Uncharacterized protein n=1 Tax=Coptis chinensis TaxID=261450 RepID=A0A835IE58_9MAGN|nr:hypothetical protein IFM89_021556 [Coptis chinensis]